jgi:CheY-like chemotaxis protein
MRLVLGPAVRLVVLTRYRGAEERARCEAAGIDAWVLKPASVEELKAARGQCVRRRA